MLQKISKHADIAALEECLARLHIELALLDRLGASFAAAKISEGCDALKSEIANLGGLAQ